MVKSVHIPGGQGEHDMFKELREVTVAGLWSMCEGRGEGWKWVKLKNKSQPVGHIKKVGFYSNSH